MTDDRLLEKLDALTAAVHELAYAQAATAAMVARQAGVECAPEDFLPDNPALVPMGSAVRAANQFEAAAARFDAAARYIAEQVHDGRPNPD
ncbi:hypothetical protein WDJ50_02570 [Deinococcus sp. VB142]|uniref:Uncharacterized protein n=1 Tax=Deinococcus sp. VB142 TaxID=3112952 RepID=A0AAU6Q4C9_9DEIO